MEAPIRKTGLKIVLDIGSTIQEYADMAQRASTLAQTLGVTIGVCWAKIETESWIIAGLQPDNSFCTLKKVTSIPPNCEQSPADPKQWLKNQLKDGYSERIQRCLAEKIDIAAAHARNASFALFCSHL